CHGFMAGLNHTLDDDLILHVLGPVFEAKNPPSAIEESVANASVFMRGLYDGVREYQRLSADPVLNRNWSTFVATVEELVMNSASAASAAMRKEG
ncbi:MAG: hypothetical protein ACK5Q1_12825, partial [Limnobacter sp.]